MTARGLFLVVALLVSLAMLPPSAAVAQRTECAEYAPRGCPLFFNRTVGVSFKDPERPHAWRLQVPDGGGFRIALTSLPEDYDLAVEMPNGTLLRSQQTGTTDEVIEVQGGVPGNYLVSVGVSPSLGLVERRAPYRLTATRTGPEPPWSREPISSTTAGSMMLLYSWDDPGFDSLIYATLSSDGKRVVGKSVWGLTTVWQLPEDEQVSSFGYRAWREGSTPSADIAAGGDLVVSVSGPGIDLWQPAGLRRIDTGDEAPAVALSPDGDLVATGGRQVKIWRVADGSLARTIPTGEENGSAVMFSPDWQFFAMVASGPRLDVRHISDGAVVSRPEGSVRSVQQVSFSQDGQSIAALDGRQTVRVWRVADGALLFLLPEGPDTIRSLSLSPDGQLLALGTQDGSIMLLKTSDGEVLRILAAHYRPTTSVRFSADGGLLASTSDDKTVRVWGVR